MYLLKISATEISNRAIQVRTQPLRSGISLLAFFFVLQLSSLAWSHTHRAAALLGKVPPGIGQIA